MGHTDAGVSVFSFFPSMLQTYKMEKTKVTLNDTAACMCGTVDIWVAGGIL